MAAPLHININKREGKNVLEQKITFMDYDKAKNACIAKNQHGEEFEIDPFVGCAIYLTDDDYESGKGADIVGKTYLMRFYSVYSHNVVPHEGGLIPLR